MTSPPLIDVGRVAHQRVGERRLARAVRAHDRVDLALPTSRSMPWRISRSGLAAGATRRPRMTSSRRLGVGLAVVVGRSRWGQGSFEGGGSVVRAGRATRGGTRSARVIESSAPATASRTRIQSTLTVQRRRSGRRRGVRGILGGADHRGERALEGAEHLAHRDRLGGSRQLVAAVGAAGARRPGRRRAGSRRAARGRPAGMSSAAAISARRRRPGPEVPPELDHQPHAVLALRAEGDGAACRGTWARGGVGAVGVVRGVPHIRVISSDMSVPR